MVEENKSLSEIAEKRLEDNKAKIEEVKKSNRKASKVSVEDIYNLLNDRLPEKSALLNLMPKTKEQAIVALGNVLSAIEGEDRNTVIAKGKIQTAINLLK